MLGWRKLSAWSLIFVLSAVVSVKVVIAGGGDIPPNVVELVKWCTGFFFGANALEHGAKVLELKGQK